MDMICTNETSAGKSLSLDFFIPEQEEIDAGERPKFVVDVLPLLIEVEEGRCSDTAGMFSVDALSVFLHGVQDFEQADIVAEWLEAMASDIRERFKK